MNSPLVVGYTVTRYLGDDEQIIAESIPNLDYAEVLQRALIDKETEGADYEIDSVYSRDFARFFNNHGYTSRDVDCDESLYCELSQKFLEVKR